LDEHSAKSTETLLAVLYNNPVIGQWAESQKQRGLIASRNNTFLCSSSFQTGSGYYPAYFGSYCSRRTLPARDTILHLVSIFRMRGAIQPLSHASS